jgi:hypothetical protein
MFARSGIDDRALSSPWWESIVLPRAAMRPALVLLLAVCAGGVWSPRISAQSAAPQGSDLRRELDQRFDALPLTRGILLTPRSPIPGVRSIELSGGIVSIDGVPVSGAEIRSRLGPDADSVLRLSLLDEATQRTFAAGAGPAAPRETAPAAPSAAPAEPLDTVPAPFFRRVRGDDRVAIGARGVTVEAGEIVRGNAVAIGGHLRVLGEVRGDAVSIGGGVELGPRAVVGRNVVVVGGALQRDPSARIGGEVQEIGWGSAQFDDWWRRAWTGVRPAGPFLGASFALAVTIMRVALVCLLAALILLLGRDYVERIGARAAAEPIKAGAIGLLAQILFFPLLIATIVVLVVTIIGIPLLVLVPFVVLGLVVIALVGFTSVAYCIGRLFSAKVGWTNGPYAATIAGIFVLVSPLLLARLAGLVLPMTFGFGIIGSIVEYLAWTVGFGAVALTRFSKTSGTSGTSGTTVAGG